MGDRRILACLLRVWGLMGIRRKNGGHYLVEEIRGKRPIPTRINAVTQFLSRNNAAIPATVNTTRNTQLHKFIFCFFLSDLFNDCFVQTSYGDPKRSDTLLLDFGFSGSAVNVVLESFPCG